MDLTSNYFHSVSYYCHTQYYHSLGGEQVNHDDNQVTINNIISSVTVVQVLYTYVSGRIQFASMF
jgi:hypothetical protein